MSAIGDIRIPTVIGVAATDPITTYIVSEPIGGEEERNTVLQLDLDCSISLAIHTTMNLHILEGLRLKSQTLEQLVEKRQLNAPMLQRLMCVLCQLEYIQESDGLYSLTESGEILRLCGEKPEGEYYRGKGWNEVKSPGSLLESGNTALERFVEVLGRKYEDPIKQKNWERATGYLFTRVLYATLEKGVLEGIAQGSGDVRALATRCKVDVNHLESALNLLQDKGICYRDVGVWKLTSEGYQVRHHQNFILMQGSVRWSCLGKVSETIRDGRVAFDREYGKNYFEFLKKNADFSKRFDLGMDAITEMELQELLSFGLFEGKKEVVDVGGGRGVFLSSVMERYSHLKGVLFDLPTVVGNPVSKLEEGGLVERCSVIGGSFFETMPASAGTYCLKRVLHDWNDEDCVKILKQIKANMQPGAEVLIIEPLLSDKDERLFPGLIDFMMMPLFQGKERTIGEMEALLNKAGLMCTGVKHVGSYLTVMTAS